MQNLFIAIVALVSASATLQAQQVKADNRNLLINYDGYAPMNAGAGHLGGGGGGVHEYNVHGAGARADASHYGSGNGGGGGGYGSIGGYGAADSYGGHNNYLHSGIYGNSAGIGFGVDAGGVGVGGATYNTLFTPAYQSGFTPVFPPSGYHAHAYNGVGGGYVGGYGGGFGGALPALQTGYSFNNLNGGIYSGGIAMSGPISSHRPIVGGLHTNIGAAFGGNVNSLPLTAYAGNVGGGFMAGVPVGGHFSHNPAAYGYGMTGGGYGGGYGLPPYK